MFYFNVTKKCLIAECWIPTRYIPQVRAALFQATEISGSTIQSVLNNIENPKGTPPTYNVVNKFTRGFQNIVDSYGVANYQEINPTPWTIITFPFLFAVMFGDSGHGFIMFLAAALLCLFEKKIEKAKIRDEIFSTFFGGRYIILLMGSFALYTGFIYNDVFSKSINLFSSSWKNPYRMELLESMYKQDGEKASLQLPPEYAFEHENGPYPFGLDPIWNVALNRLNFLNPMKMKMSVLLGIAQMFFGLVLSYFNHRHNKSNVDVFFVFIPQVLFLSLIFVYLCVQIVLKWIFFWVKPGIVLGQFYPGSSCAPSLLVGLINMFMFKERQQGFVHNLTYDDTTGDVNYILNDQCSLQLWYPYQNIVEAVFILIAVACIPIMFFVKPLIYLSRARSGKHVDMGHGHGDDEGKGEFNFGDVIVYQGIHTIEFALGCISHTASYLRLWALSLAHAQLSDVLWSMLFKIGLVTTGYPGVALKVIVFFVFGTLSVAILILMEGLSAFLHALRLHWVEFQSKFYGGAGVPFQPLSFEKQIRIHEGLDQ